MEDAHIILPTIARDPETSFFAVFDGHGGAQAARLLRENLYKEIVNRKEYAEGKITDALRNAFIDFDKKMMMSRVLANDIVGSTAVTVLIKNNTLYCANLGDSRAVASIRGHAAALSFDHKPSKPKERKRIEAAGSFVFEDRVNGSLAIARCFGDFALKKRSNVPAELQPVSCYPDVSIKQITEELEFVVLACDGIWECRTNQQVVDFVRRQIACGIPPEKIVENIMMDCLARDFSKPVGFDNMTVILVCFTNKRPYVEFCQRCCEPAPEDLDPHALMITLETGPPEKHDMKHAPRRQRHWGVNYLQEREQSKGIAYTSLIESQLQRRTSSQRRNSEKEEMTPKPKPQAEAQAKTTLSAADFRSMKESLANQRALERQKVFANSTSKKPHGKEHSLVKRWFSNSKS